MGNCEELKVGDKVVLTTRGGSYLRTVERLTQTQVVVSGSGNKFRRNDGQRVGGDTWSFTSIKPTTHEDIENLKLAAIKQQKKSLVNNYFYKFNPSKMSEKQLDVMIETIEKLNDLKREEGEVQL